MPSKLLNAILFAILSCTGSLFADTTSIRSVGPGVVHTQHTVPGPNTVNVVEVDLKNPLLSLETYRPEGITPTSVQAAANDSEGHKIVAAINGDFFSFTTEWPTGNQVANGKPVQGLISLRSHLAVTEEKKPFIEQIAFTGEVVTKNGALLDLNGVNYSRQAGLTLLYTSFYGRTTRTDGSGIECELKLISPRWRANDTLFFLVTSKETTGNMTIPSNDAVLSAGNGGPANFIASNIVVGDTIKVYVGFSPTFMKNIVQLIGGAGRIVKNGVNVVASSTSAEELTRSFVNTRYARTFVGFNADISKFYLCTVNGSGSSVGMTFNEMANFLLSISVTDAFNLCGAGPSGMVVRGTVVSSWDGGGANSLQVISTAPTGTLANLNIIEDHVGVFEGKTFQFHAEAGDPFYNPLPLPAGAVWSVDSAIGTIDNTGLLTTRHINDSGWVRIQYDTLSDSAQVLVRVVKELRVYPQTLIMLPGERLTLSIRGIDTGNNKLVLENNRVTYVNNATELNIDAEGVATSTGFGKGMLTAKLDTIARSVYYNASGADTIVVAEDFHDMFNWTVKVQNTDPINITLGLSEDAITNHPPSLRIDYSFPPPSADVLFSTSLPASGVIDSIFLNVYGDGGGHSLILSFSDTYGQAFAIVSPTIVDWKNEWRAVGFNMADATPDGAIINFPIMLTRIQIVLGTLNQSGGKAVGTIFVDDLSIHYPYRTVTPAVLLDFNTGVAGWLQPIQQGPAERVGIKAAVSGVEFSAEHPYEGNGCAKWTFVDDTSSSLGWDVRIARDTTQELGPTLRGSFVGAWIWANGQTNLTLRIVIRAGGGQLCQGPVFQVDHVGWKLISGRLVDSLFTPYFTGSKISEADNHFDGFRVQGPNDVLQGEVRTFFVDKIVTSALTIPSGFADFIALWDNVNRMVTLRWGVNSQIFIARYVVERSSDGVNFVDIDSLSAGGDTETPKSYSYNDITATSGGTYTYQIVQMTKDGSQELSPKVTVVTTGVRAASPQTAYTFNLHQNFPNPFNPTTRFRFSIPEFQFVTLAVYDLLGRQVAILVSEKLNAGNYTVEWNAANYPSAVYFCQLRTGNLTVTRKFMMVK